MSAREVVDGFLLVAVLASTLLPVGRRLPLADVLAVDSFSDIALVLELDFNTEARGGLLR